MRASDPDGQESGDLECLLDKIARGFNLLPTTTSGMYSNQSTIDSSLNCIAEENQRRLMVLGQAHVNSTNMMDPLFIQHQHIEHNFDHVCGLLRELRSDLTALQELKSKGGNILQKIESVCKMMEQGDFDKDKNFIPASV